MTPNSATPPQSTCCRLPEDETGQIQTRSGPSEKRGFWQTPAGLNVLYSLEAGQWLALRQVARAHGRLVAYSGNENRIGRKGACNESEFTIPYWSRCPVLEDANAKRDCSRCLGDQRIMLVTVGRGREMDVGRWYRHVVISVKGGAGRRWGTRPTGENKCTITGRRSRGAP